MGTDPEGKAGHELGSVVGDDPGLLARVFLQGSLDERVDLGLLHQELVDGAPGFGKPSIQLLKKHGTYQLNDRETADQPMMTCAERFAATSPPVAGLRPTA